MASFRSIIITGIILINTALTYGQDHLRFQTINKQEFNWMRKKGFNTQMYNWQHDAVNRQVRWALNKRKASGSWVKAGTGLWFLTGILYSMAAGATSTSKDANQPKPMAFVGLGLGFTAITIIPSICKSKKAKRYIRTAEKVRKNL